MTTTTTENTRRVRIPVVAGIVAFLALCLGAVWALNGTKGDDVATAPTTSVSKDQLAAAADARVFFGHQSVGANIIDGIPGVYESAGVTTPEITTEPTETSNGFFAHGYIGENGDPLGKIEDFDATMRGGMADKVDLALMKLCYVDVTAGTDVEAVFAEYQTRMAALEHDVPDVTFLYTTVPLTTENGWLKSTAKRILGRADTNTSDNVAREQYNALVRQTYAGTGRLYDIAAIQSTAPDGSRVAGRSSEPSYAMAAAYAADPGHLNAVGSQVAASALLEAIAEFSN